MRDYIEYVAFRVISGIVGWLSFGMAHSLGSSLGAIVFNFTGIRKKVTIDNIQKSLPSLAPGEVRNIARGAFRNYGISICEMLWTRNKTETELKQVVHPVNREAFDEGSSLKKGVVLLSGHFGCWEMILQGTSLHLGVPGLAVAQEQRNSLVDAFITETRSRHGNKVVYMERSVREVLKILNSGGMVTLLGDQSAPRESVFVEFFGRPAATHRGAAVFSLKTGAPIIMVFHVRRPDGTYDAVFERVDQSGLASYSEENVIELTRRHTALLEKYIRQYPEHWLWMHKRWKHTEYYQSLQASGASTKGKP